MAAAPATTVRSSGGTYTAPWRREADAAADRNQIPRSLFRALIAAESGWREKARSAAGAIGLTQLMPGTARGLGVDPHDPLQNLEGGARYLRQQLDRFGDVELALAAYNAGPGAVARYGGVPPFAETRRYVDKVLAAAGDLAGAVEAKFEDWVRPASGVDLENVNASLLARLFLLGAYLEKPIVATSGYRSTEHQARLYDEFVEGKRAGPVAKPGSSKHERGAAVDATIDGEPIGKAVPEATLKEFGLRSLSSIDDPVHVEELEGAEIKSAGFGPAAALAIAAGLKLVPKAATKLRGLLGRIGGGTKKTGSSLAKITTIGGLLAALDVTGAIDLKRGALWLLFTLLGLALVLLGVLRLVGIKSGTVVNIVKGVEA